jgi:hypothetical protein
MIQNRPKPVILEETTIELELHQTEIPEPDQRVHDLMLGTLLNGCAFSFFHNLQIT